jgi:hypothetical protein
LPNPNFRNQEFFVKKQELIRRFSPKIRGEIRRLFVETRRKTGRCHVLFFGKARIALSQVFIISVLANE